MNDFNSLSVALTGNAKLPPATCGELEALLAAHHGVSLAQLLALWATKPPNTSPEDFIGQALWIDPQHRRLCQDIILSWMFGAPFSGGQPLPVADGQEEDRASLWFDGLFWQLTHAHAPGVSGGYFGHWAYPAERHGR